MCPMRGGPLKSKPCWQGSGVTLGRELCENFLSLLCSGLSVLLGPEWLPVRVGVNHEWICSLSFCGFCTSRHCELPSVHTLLSNHKATETPRRPSRLTWMVPREQVASDAPGAPGGGETSSPAATPCELQGELMAECVADMPVTIAPFCMGGMIWVAYSWLHSPLHPCLFLGLPGGSSGAKNLPSKLVWCVSANPCRPSSQPTVSVAATRHPCRWLVLRGRSSSGWCRQQRAQSPDARPRGLRSAVQGTRPAACESRP